MVWAATPGARIIGPFILDENVNENLYLKMLISFSQSSVVSLLRQSFFRHDGAPPHWQKSISTWLNEMPRICGLTLADAFLWGFIKGLVYKQNYEYLDQLKTAIFTACVFQ